MWGFDLIYSFFLCFPFLIHRKSDDPVAATGGDSQFDAFTKEKTVTKKSEPKQDVVQYQNQTYEGQVVYSKYRNL